MLVIGDVPANSLLGNSNIKVRNVEILYYTDDKQYIETTLGLEKGKRFNKYTTCYVKNKQSFFLHNARKMDVLNYLMEHSFATKKAFKLATPLINYTYMRAKTQFLHKDIQSWVNAIQIYNYTHSQQIQKLIACKSKVAIEMKKVSDNMNKLVCALPNINSEPYMFSPFDTYKEVDLYNIITTERCSRYLQVSSPSNRLLFKTAWDKMTHPQKMEAILEKIYVTLLNEIVIPTENNGYHIDEGRLREYFLKSMMFIAASSTDKWFINYMIYNFNTLVDNFETGFYTVYINAKKYCDLEKVK